MPNEWRCVEKCKFHFVLLAIDLVVCVCVEKNIKIDLIIKLLNLLTVIHSGK